MIGSPEYYGSALSSPYLRDLRIVYRNASHLQGLVNDVLDLARIESAQMTLTLAQVAPGELTSEAVETVRSLVESRGLRLTTQIAPGLPSIWLDATRIRQVLINLLNNAARYTPHGAVCVSLKEMDDALHFAVSDTGIGISPSDLTRIFDEFYQVEGEGSTFFFTLPFHPALDATLTPTLASPVASATPAGASAQAGDLLPVAANRLTLGHDAQRVLLVVTDSNSAVGLLSRHLPQYRVLAASGLAQAQTLARQVLPQAVVVDSNCAALDTTALTEVGRAWGMLHTPMISCPLPGEVPLRKRLAVDGYLIKPVERQNLWDTVRSFGESVEQILIVDDNRDFVRLLRQMLVNPLRPYNIECAYSGEEALAKVRLSPPDLLLLDLGLPDLSGVHVVEMLRDHPMWHSIPIVIVSAQDELDGLEVLQGGITVTKAGGMLPGDLVRWLGGVIGTKA